MSHFLTFNNIFAKSLMDFLLTSRFFVDVSLTSVVYYNTLLTLQNVMTTHSFIHSLLVKLPYRSRTQDSFGYTIQTSRNSITVFIQCTFNEVFITQMTIVGSCLSCVRRLRW